MMIAVRSRKHQRLHVWTMDRPRYPIDRHVIGPHAGCPHAVIIRDRRQYPALGVASDGLRSRAGLLRPAAADRAAVAPGDLADGGSWHLDRHRPAVAATRSGGRRL